MNARKVHAYLEKDRTAALGAALDRAEAEQRDAVRAAVLEGERRIDALEAELLEQRRRGEELVAGAAVMVSALERISATCACVLERIAEVGAPPPWWSGTQLDPVRVRTVVCDALDAWDRS